MSELIDNTAQRIRTLKEIVQQLHDGAPPERVKSQLKEMVCQTDCAEIAAMEQQLIADGMPIEKLQAMCDLHSQVTKEILVQLPPPSLPPGHPVDTFRRENEALRGVMLKMRQAMAEIRGAASDAGVEASVLALRQALNDLMDIDKHYQRKENALFSCLERHGISGPSKVMWAKDDEVRGLLKNLGEALRQDGVLAAQWSLVITSVAAPALAAVEEMIYKEENILLPMALNALTQEEWAQIWLDSPRYGWCLVEPRDGYRPPESMVQEALKLSGGDAIQLPTGNLALEQLLGIFRALPVDITFVDAGDRVAFFSEGPDRVFARSKAIIGRKVQHCHPPRSVAVVDRILADFREGRQSVAEFWIDFMGRFVHIRYFAVRDEAGSYLGTLEVTQDASRIRALQGERRLLEY